MPIKLEVGCGASGDGSRQVPFHTGAECGIRNRRVTLTFFTGCRDVGAAAR